MPVNTNAVLVLAAILFVLGLVGVMTRKNIIFILVSVEIMLNAAGIAFVAAGARWGQPDGQIMFLFILAMAAAEVSVGLALVLQAYHQYKTVAMSAVLESYQRLCAQYDAVIVEGAGSPAEINLRDRDIANMGFAEVVDCPVALIADIDRGGVFAHLVGTLQVLAPS